MSFPKDFLWGSASAAYQIEGAASIDGKGPSIWDVYSSIPGNTFKNTTGEVAIDFYHKYEEDINLMKEMGLKAYRFSVSWPRILPKGKGEVNQKGIEFYHKVIDKLIENNIEPILTIYHWDLPQALQDEYGGWESREIIEDFANYCNILYKEYGKKVKYWVSLNEQNIFTSLGYLLKLHPPKKSNMQTFINVNHIANLANARAIEEFRKHVPNGLIGPSFAYGPTYAKSAHPKDVLAMENAQELNNFLWLDVYARGEYSPLAINLLKSIGITIDFQEGDKELLKKGIPDFMGVNYYSTATYGHITRRIADEINNQKGNTVQSDVKELITDKLFVPAKNEFVRLTDWNWVIDPDGLRIALRRITSRYNLPTLITENGLGAYDTLEDGQIHDDYRIEYLKEHIEAIRDSINDGCNVLGYCTWSFQDLFSWLNGYSKRYGFVFVDRDEESEKELKRYKKDSFYWYKKVIDSNGEDL
jgi:6-phospho-beta-glucosidase